MRFQHGLGRFFFSRLSAVGRVLLHFLAFRGRRAIGPNIENLVEPQPGKKVAAALAAMDDVKMALTNFSQSKGDRGQRSHKCRIHHRAILQVDDELAVTAIDHFLGEFL